MPKAAKQKRAGGANTAGPYDRKPSKGPGANGAKGGSSNTNIFRFDKDFGQHILKNPGISDAIVDKAFLKPTDVVVEVGPGTGNSEHPNQRPGLVGVSLGGKLTLSVSHSHGPGTRKGKEGHREYGPSHPTHNRSQLTRPPVELDPRMGAEVTKRVQGTPLAKKLEVILGDVIKMPEIPPCDALISNTPYQISSPLIFKMLSMPNPPRVAVLMVRRNQPNDPSIHPYP